MALKWVGHSREFFKCWAKRVWRPQFHVLGSSPPFSPHAFSKPKSNISNLAEKSPERAISEGFYSRSICISIKTRDFRVEQKEVKNIKTRKAAFLTLGLYSFLVWLYVVARIVFDYVDVDILFFNSVPFLTFAELGIISFVFSMIFIFMYLRES